LRPFVPAGQATVTAIVTAAPPLSSCAVSASSTNTVGCTGTACESSARAVLPRSMTTEAVTCASPSWNPPPAEGTLTKNIRGEPMQVSGNDACPDAPGCPQAG